MGELVITRSSAFAFLFGSGRGQTGGWHSGSQSVRASASLGDNHRFIYLLMKGGSLFLSLEPVTD